MNVTRKANATFSKVEVIAALKAYYPNNMVIQGLPDATDAASNKLVTMEGGPAAVILEWVTR
ncbi:hypothetical protein [Roseomonas sp. WA12]